MRCVQPSGGFAGRYSSCVEAGHAYQAEEGQPCQNPCICHD
jgi:hypothetical protein